MITIIAGCRDLYDIELVRSATASCPWKITRVVSGRQRGIDTLGEQWAREHGLEVDPFPADWDRYGMSAGPRRNVQMAKHVVEAGGGGLLLIWRRASPGSRNMLTIARRKGLSIHEYVV